MPVHQKKKKETLFMQNFAQPIIAEIENWLKQQEQQAEAAAKGG
jgi:hypothetical protein